MTNTNILRIHKLKNKILKKFNEKKVFFSKKIIEKSVQTYLKRVFSVL